MKVEKNQNPSIFLTTYWILSLKNGNLDFHKKFGNLDFFFKIWQLGSFCPWKIFCIGWNLAKFHPQKKYWIVDPKFTLNLTILLLRNVVWWITSSILGTVGKPRVSRDGFQALFLVLLENSHRVGVKQGII
jgi:hypothetical protein